MVVLIWLGAWAVIVAITFACAEYEPMQDSIDDDERMRNDVPTDG